MTKSELLTQFNNAIHLEKNGDYEDALKEYSSVLNSDATFRNAYVNLGSLYSRMNRLPEAMKCYEAALSLGHDYITYFNIGCILYKMGNYHDAHAYLSKSIVANNKFILSKLISGLCQSRLNNFSEAEKNFLDVLNLWPKNRVAMTALAIIYYNKNDYEQSLLLLNMLLELDSDNIKIRELRYNILFQLGQIDQSISEIKIIKSKSDGYKFFDEFIKSVPVETFTDKYGTLDEKIQLLHDRMYNDLPSLISLSLCHLIKGDSDAAIDFLFKYKKKNLN